MLAESNLGPHVEATWDCRATAVASKLLGLDCHLILRNSRALADSDPGLVGNLMVERLAGATIHQVDTLISTEHYSAELAGQQGAMGSLL